MKKKKIIFLVLPHVQLLDLAGPDQVFLEANGYGAELDVIYCGIGHAVNSSSGITIDKLESFRKVEPGAGDYLIIPGIDVDRFVEEGIPYQAAIEEWVQQAYDAGVNVCSVCSGAFFLARTGLLNRRKCTTHWKRTAQLKRMYPLAQVLEDVLFTDDERIITSAGVTAGIDMSLYILTKMKDDHFSFKVARELVVYARRRGNDQQQSVFMQYRNHIHSGVHRVQDYLQDNMQQRLTLTDLADLACMSSRNLTRVFKKETGITVNSYISLVRKEYLRKLVVNPDITRKQMATLCGLKSARQVIRILKDN